MREQIAIIIGGGPAGLTAAYELAKNSNVKPIIIEKEDILGGISKTVNYKGNRIDIGGHRFFSKSDTVMNWWQDMMPTESEAMPADKNDKVMLVRNRISRIYFLRKFFDYPIGLSLNTIKNLGIVRFFKIGFSYMAIRVCPIRKEKSLEDFYINRFGKELYKTFFRDYTEKVWGIECSKISPEWGSQRVKGLSVTKAIMHALKSKRKSTNSGDISQKGTETSLIEKFIYPKYGPGQLWEYVGSEVIKNGGEIIRNSKVTKIVTDGNQIKEIEICDKDGNTKTLTGDHFISTMPMKDLIASLDCEVPSEVKSVSDGLVYRDFMTVGLLLKKMNTLGIKEKLYPDTWIYIQEREVKLGRVQIFNNWSPYMVADKDNVWIGLEYFVNEGDELWNMADDKFKEFAIKELESISMIKSEDVIDSTVLRVEKAYPAYFGTYYELDKVTEYINRYDNLFLVGRNGMHKYNNMDHSMLTAIKAVEIITGKGGTKSDIWNINTEQEYHESKK